MILETAQLLATTYRLQKLSPVTELETRILPASTHANHPCRLWTGASKGNYLTLASIGVYLCREYTKRYSKTHVCEKIIKYLALQSEQLEFTNATSREVTTPPICMFPAVKDTARKDFLYLTGLTESYLTVPEVANQLVIYSYRFYYLTSKAHFAQWNYSAVPAWYANNCPELGIVETLQKLGLAVNQQLPAVDLSKYQAV